MKKTEQHLILLTANKINTIFLLIFGMFCLPFEEENEKKNVNNHGVN
jgi:hypothetical protein